MKSPIAAYFGGSEKAMPTKFPIRVAGSMLVASIVVYALLMLGVGVMQKFEPDDQDPMKIHPVNLLEAYQRKRWSEELGEDKRKLPERPHREQMPRYELPEREVSGFVQIEVMIGADGIVEEVEVVGAAPSGVYEEQAMEIIRQRLYSPDVIDGVAVPSTLTEIIDFTVPAALSVDTQTQDQTQDQAQD